VQTKSASKLATTQTTKCRSKVGPEHADRLRARVLWYALRTAVLEGRGAASFRRSDLERMLELPPGAPLDGVLACLPSDAVRVEVGDNRVRLKQPDGDDYVEQVLLHWKAATGRTDRVVFDGKRRGLVRRAIRDGYTPDQLCTAISAMAASKWHRGDNPNGRRYDDVTHALGSAERIDRWLDEPQSGRSEAEITKPMQEARAKAQQRRAANGRRRRRQ